MEFINGCLEYPQVFRFKTLFKALASKRKQKKTDPIHFWPVTQSVYTSECK